MVSPLSYLLCKVLQGLRVCRAAMTWPATVGSAISLSGGGRGAMPTVCGTCAGAVVVTVRECVLAIGS